MALLRVQTSWRMDSSLPRDQLACVVYFDVQEAAGALTVGHQAIADSVATMFDLGWNSPGAEITTKVYDLGDAEPRPPRGTKVLHTGTIPASTMPREIALCLSFYAQRNLPTNRGRIYLPGVVGFNSGVLAARPTTSILDKAIALATTANQSLPDIGGVNVKHVVYSQRERVAKQVTNYFVDDEWDTVRKRGLRPNTRRTAAREG